jgi:hypothetical protein
MRGGDVRTGELFSYVDLEDRVRRDHPLRTIRLIVNEALASLEGEFAALYSPIGRPSIAPEKLLRAMLLQAFYSIRSERLLMERLEYDLSQCPTGCRITCRRPAFELRRRFRAAHRSHGQWSRESVCCRSSGQADAAGSLGNAQACFWMTRGRMPTTARFSMRF